MPAYRLHKSTGQAVVTIKGKDYYLGKHNSTKSKAKYADLVGGDGVKQSLQDLTNHYIEHSKEYYRNSTEVDRIRRAFELFHEAVGGLEVGQLSKVHFRQFLKRCVASDLCRRYTNQLFACLLRGFKWLSSNDFLAADTYHDLRLVEPLKAGRTDAIDHPLVSPAAMEDIFTVVKSLQPMQAAMVLTQLYTGMRPGEMLAMLPASIDRNLDPWVYTPKKHKNAYRGHSRKIYLGPKAQAAIAPWIDPAFEYVFSPKKIKEKLGDRVPGNRYLSTSYSRMLLRACIKAGVKPFTPHQLRHTAATRIVTECGWQAARAVLGHKSLNTTLIYVESELSLALPAVGRLG